MELRSGIYKGLHGVLPQQARPRFEEGVNLLFSRWTALCLAIDNEWGGRNSREKAEQIYNDVLHWFYNHKEHYADDLEVDLQDILLQDFNLEAQDDSCREVATVLVDRDGTVLDDDSSDDSSEDGSDMQMDEAEAPAAVRLDAPKAPVVDDDGFELVQGKSKGRRRQQGVH
eukprot:jgi/Astpho2/425/Aster-x0926